MALAALGEHAATEPRLLLTMPEPVMAKLNPGAARATRAPCSEIHSVEQSAARRGRMGFCGIWLSQNVRALKTRTVFQESGVVGESSAVRARCGWARCQILP